MLKVNSTIWVYWAELVRDAENKTKKGGKRK